MVNNKGWKIINCLVTWDQRCYIGIKRIEITANLIGQKRIIFMM